MSLWNREDLLHFKATFDLASVNQTEENFLVLLKLFGVEFKKNIHSDFLVQAKINDLYFLVGLGKVVIMGSPADAKGWCFVTLPKPPEFYNES